MTKYIFVTGGVVSGLGKGITAASLGRLLKQRGLQGRGAEARPLHQRRPRHDEPLSARRGLRHRRRRGDRPRSRPLRALHRRETSTSTPTSPPARSIGTCSNKERARRVSRLAPCRSSRTSPTRSRNSIYQCRQEDRRGRGHHRDRRHHRRHRVPAVPRGRPADRRSRSGGRTRLFIHVTLVPYSPWLGRAQVQADAALRQGAAGHGHPAGHHRPALRRAARGRPSSARSPCSATCKPDCVIENMTLPMLYEAPLMLEEAHLSDVVCRELGYRRARRRI